ncbi:putative reverse transcriptase domain-containing protein [Tanacetum coccineum]
MTNTRSGMTHAAIEEMINQRVNAALEAHQVNQNLELRNGNDNGNDNGNGNRNDNGNGNGNGNNGGDNGDGNKNHNVNRRGDRLVARECTYQDFMKCQPTSFKGTEGVVSLIRWSEKMETVFHITLSREISKPTRLQDAVRITNNLMDQKLKGCVVKNAEIQENVARAYVAGNNEERQYEGTLPLCNKCKLHHVGPCTTRCGKCNKIGHLTRNCRDITGKIKIKNQNRGNKARVPDARGRAYALGGGDVNPGSNTVTGTFLLNDHHAYMLFDSGADRSFVSNTFSALLDITPYALDVSYAIELADGRTSD